MDIKNPTGPCICCYTTLWNIDVSKTSDRLPYSVATYLRCGGLLITKLRKVYCWVWVKKIKSVNIWQSYKQERDWQNYGHESVARFLTPPCRYEQWSGGYLLLTLRSHALANTVRRFHSSPKSKKLNWKMKTFTVLRDTELSNSM